MENGALIGALAICTIGAALLIGIAYFAYFLRDPRNREHAHRTLVRDEKSASTERREDAGKHDHGTAPLKQRLDHSEASAHPDDPTRAVPAP